MINLLFGSLFSILTTVFVAGMLVFIALAHRYRSRIQKWGWLIGLFILIGTAISAFSAMRDGYATTEAVFAMNSMQSSLCSIAGGAIFLTGLVSIFLKNQLHKQRCFYIISGLFIIQVLVIEISRLL